MRVSKLIKQSQLSIDNTLTIVEYLTNIDKNTLFLYKDKIDVDFQAFDKIASKVLNGMPIQYAIGKWWFFGEEFFIEPPILIPRPETELVVENALNLIRDFEIGFEPFAGSGIISIILLKHFKHLKMITTDINKKACNLTLKNARFHGVEDRIFVICTDIAMGLNLNGVDFLVANPPYIPTDKLSSLDKSILEYEDIKALDGREHGMFFYEKLKNLNIKPMVLEIGHDQEELIKGLFNRVDIKYDYSGFPRVAIVY